MKEHIVIGKGCMIFLEKKIYIFTSCCTCSLFLSSFSKSNMFLISLIPSASCSSAACSSNRVLLHNGKQASIPFFLVIYHVWTSSVSLGHTCVKLQKHHILFSFFALSLLSLRGAGVGSHVPPSVSLSLWCLSQTEGGLFHLWRRAE